MTQLFNILMWIWQFPQHLLALILIPFHCTKINTLRTIIYNNKKVYILENFRGGICLGNYILVDYYRTLYLKDILNNSKLALNIKHEYGHSIQSEKLGILYLVIIGLPSLLNNIIHRWLKNTKYHYDYYSFYTEKWANKLAGIK